MKRTLIGAWVQLVCLLCVFCVSGLQAQQPVAAAPQAPSGTVQLPPELVPTLPVPRLVKFSGVAKDELSKPRTGTVGITFAIYKEQEGGAALWLETQNVELDEQGHYTVLLGTTKSEGLPLELFAAGEPRWLGVQVNLPREVEQPRVLLVSVPYALKAADAETLGGKPLSSFVLATPPSAGGAGAGKAPNLVASTTAVGAATIGGGGTQNFVAKFDPTGTNVVNSQIFDDGTNVGIGTASPARSLHIRSANPTIRLEDTALPNSFWELHQSAFFLDTFGFVRYESGKAVEGKSFVVTNAGNLGVGTGTPQRKLHIKSSAPIIRLEDTSPSIPPNTFWELQQSAFFVDTFGFVRYESGAAVANKSFVMSSAGNFGIGITAPAQKLSVAGVIQSTTGGFKFPDSTVQTTASLGGSVSSVGSGLGLTGGPITSSGTLAINTAVVPQLGVINTFTTDQNIVGNLNLTAATSTISAFGGTFVGSGGGVAGKDTSIGGIGVFGNASNPTGPGVGVFGVSPADNAAGVIGKATSLTGLTSGLVALAASTGAVAAFAHATATTGNTFAVQGIADSIAGIGVYGNATATSGTTAGVQGNSASLSGVGGYFTNSAGGFMLAAVDSGGKPILAADPNGAYVHTAVFASNNDATGTVLNELVKYTSADTVSVTGAGDPGGAIGIVVSGAGTAGTAVVAYFGEAHCAFDNTTVVADYFQISPTVAGQCHDAGPAYPANGRQVLGRVTKITSVPPKVFLFGGEETRPGGVYNISGALQSGHVVTGSVTLSSGTATVTLSGAAAFTSSTSYVCVATPTTATATVTVSQTSGTSFTLNSATLAAGVNFTCTGN
jgi:hypothetical protein